MSERPRKDQEPVQERERDHLALDTETLKDLSPKDDDATVRGGVVRLSTIIIGPSASCP